MAKSVYGRVRVSKAQSVLRGTKTLRNIGGVMLASSGGVALALSPVAGGAMAVAGAILDYGLKGSQRRFAREALRANVVSRMVANTKARNAAALKAASSPLFGHYDRSTTLLENGVPGAERSLGKAQQSLRNYYALRGVTPTIAAKGAAAASSIARARGVIAQTAAARSMAASRKAVPRPAGQRARNNESKGGDGQTEGYYRNQGGKRVYVQGYATPAGRGR